MHTLLQQVSLSSPLFILVFAGYGLMKLAHWSKSMADALTQFVFAVALPAMLFRLMSDFTALPPVDVRLLLAYFGGCLLVFLAGRLVAWRCFRLDGVAQSVFALGGVFSNNVMLGLPIARLTLGEEAVPAVALVLVFNALTLWTLVTVSVEWARHGQLSARGFYRTARGVLTNPLVVGIVLGALFGLTGLSLPKVLAVPLDMIAQAAAPLSLMVLGMGLAQYGVREGWRISAAIATIKLLLQPLVVWGLALLLGLPVLETQVVVLLAAIATGANVYLMARQFGVLEGPVASCLVWTTVLAALTMPLMLTLTAS